MEVQLPTAVMNPHQPAGQFDGPRFKKVTTVQLSFLFFYIQKPNTEVSHS